MAGFEQRRRRWNRDDFRRRGNRWRKGEEVEENDSDLGRHRREVEIELGHRGRAG